MSQALTAWMALAAQARWSDLSFSRLLDALRHQRLLPLALAEVDARSDALLGPLQTQLEQDARARVEQEDSLLARTFSALSVHGCRALLLKGVALGRWLYPRAELRPATDVDLLVAPEQHLLAHSALVANGFESDGYSQFDEAACQACYRLDSSGRQLDLHWALAVVPELVCGFRFDELWQRSIPLPRPPGARVLCRVDALMHAVVHYRAHLPADERPAMWLHDIALLARGLSSEEWSDLDRRVRGAGLAGLHAATFAEAASWFRMSLPTEILDVWIQAGQREASRHWLAPRAHPLARFARSLNALPGWRQRLRFLRLRLLPDTRWMRGRYHAEGRVGLLLAYLRRWAEGLRQAANRIPADPGAADRAAPPHQVPTRSA